MTYTDITQKLVWEPTEIEESAFTDIGDLQLYIGYDVEGNRWYWSLERIQWSGGSYANRIMSDGYASTRGGAIWDGLKRVRLYRVRYETMYWEDLAKWHADEPDSDIDWWRTDGPF